MEIKNTLFKQVDPYRTARKTKDETASGRTKSADETAPSLVPNDRVSLSPSALLHKAAHEAANRAPDVRREKVDGIRERLANDDYTVDAGRIARKLLESDSLLAASLDY
jgi:negative regulator of flagellin synthesis FlgM